MSIDLVLWVGEQPDSDEDAAAEFRRRYADQSPQPPAPELTAFIEMLLQRWPEHDDGDEEQLWGEGPVPDIIRGSFFHTVVMNNDLTDEALGYIIAEAPRHGLVAYDPQLGGLMR